MSNDPRDNQTVQRNDESDSATEVGLNPESRAQKGAVETNDEPEEIPLKGKIAEFAARFRRPTESAREQKAGDRLRGALILGATTIGCLFLFFGLFTTTSDSAKKERKTQPSLGRPEGTTTVAEAANRSVVPQLNVTQQPNEDTGELTEKDLLGTMRSRGTPIPTENVPQMPTVSRAVPKPPLASIDFEDPALTEAYRRQGLTPPPRRTADVTDWNAAIAEHQTKENPKSTPSAPPSSPTSEALGKSSFVYVRTSVPVVTAGGSAIPTVQSRRTTTLLAQGTKLVARLQYAVSSAAKAPVVAVIEYNYEQNGELVVPAGTKAYGTLAQATPQGWVSIQFDALEYPGGKQEKINGSALSMEQDVLRGDVNGKNTGKKFLTRALTGIGTIAAFAVGGRGLGGQLDNSILLRERLSSNVAMAGEQQLAMLAFQQNIVVTLPANTRFYIVLNEPGIEAQLPQQDALTQRRNATTGAREVPVGSPLAGMSPQELQELISIRNEMREMNRLIKSQPPPTLPTQEPEK